ncbi:winged helix-turn-helix domain-containing protein [Myxococcota bacterium]
MATVALQSCDSAARSAIEPLAPEIPILALAHASASPTRQTARLPRVAVCGMWQDVQELCEAMSTQARLTWYGDPQAIAPHDVVIYVEGRAGTPWSLAWVREARARAGGAPVLVVADDDSPHGALRLQSLGASHCIQSGTGAEGVVARALSLVNSDSLPKPEDEHPEVEIDPLARTIRVGGTAARVTTSELLIFRYLVDHAEMWKTANEILRDVLGEGHCPQSPVVRVHVFRLRRALGDMAWCVQSHQGKGYRFTLRCSTTPPPPPPRRPGKSNRDANGAWGPPRSPVSTTPTWVQVDSHRWGTGRCCLGGVAAARCT